MADYLPILVMAGLVVAFVLFSFIASKLLAPQRPNAAKQAPYECGIVPEQEPAERFPVKFYLVAMSFIVLDVEIVFLYPFSIVYRGLGLFGLVAMAVFVARVARAVRVPAVGRRARVGSGARRARTPARSAAAHEAERARSERPAGRGRVDGSRSSPAQLRDRAARGRRALGPSQLRVPRDVRSRVLRARDDGDRRRALRPRALRHGSVPRVAAAGRPDDRRRSRVAEDGAGVAPGVRPDGRAEVGHLDGCVREQRWDVQQLRDRAGRRPDRSRRRLRAGLPARPGNTDARHLDVARSDSYG